MVIACLFSLASAFILAGRVVGNKTNYERVFFSVVLSFVILLSFGVILSLIGQIGPIQLAIVNLLLFAAVFYRYKLTFGAIEMDKDDALVILIFLVSFFIRAAPIISDPMPFGSYDVIQHYAMGMETYERGSVPEEFPKYLNWYGTSQDNVNGVWVYPPGNAIMSAVMKSVFNLSWPFTIHIFSALFDSLTILIIYMFAGKILKNKRVGLVAGALFGISGKNIFSLYFGQVAYELGIMLALFALFTYIIETGSRKHSMILSGIVGGLSFLVSPLAAGYFIIASLFISLYEFSKSKKISHVKEFALTTVLVLAVSALFLPKFVMWFSFFGAKPSNTPDSISIPDLVWPFKMIEKQPGLPGWYFDPNATMGTIWLIALVGGLLITVFTKFEGKKILVPWFAADYILTHSYILWGPLGFGVLYDYAGRWMAQSTIILALVAGLVSMYKISTKDNKIFLSNTEGFSLGYIILILVLLVNVPDKIATANSIYSQPYRMSADVFSLSNEIRNDAKENSAMLVFSANVQAADERRGLLEALTKTRVYTKPNVNNDTLNLTFTHTYPNGSINYETRYIMFDYGGFAKTQQFTDYVANYRNIENALFYGSEPTFSRGEVNVYRIGQ
ncbi:MAG: hypothetical protein HYT71_00890 [Candidatus Aenigmarchaeota archaeon]|nr:hypothetical protein [Candidatus Aenigmarchaeota archaeon]